MSAKIHASKLLRSTLKVTFDVQNTTFTQNLVFNSYPKVQLAVSDIYTLSLDRILAQFPGELPAKTSQPSTL